MTYIKVHLKRLQRILNFYIKFGCGFEETSNE